MSVPCPKRLTILNLGTGENLEEGEDLSLLKNNVHKDCMGVGGNGGWVGECFKGGDPVRGGARGQWVAGWGKQ